MNTYNIIDNISSIIGDKKSVAKLFSFLEDVFVTDIQISDSEKIVVDVGIGCITAVRINNTLEWGFTPSKTVEQKLVNNKDLPISEMIGKSIVYKILTKYQELL